MSAPDPGPEDFIQVLCRFCGRLTSHSTTEMFSTAYCANCNQDQAPPFWLVRLSCGCQMATEDLASPPERCPICYQHPVWHDSAMEIPA